MDTHTACWLSGNFKKVGDYGDYLTTINHKNMSELQLQARCFQWAHNNYPQLRKLLFAVPNGGRRSKREAMALKASGVVAGIPDLICVYGGVPVGIELKEGDKYDTSDDQDKVHARWNQEGITVHVVRTFEEFQSLIIKIIS